MFFSNVLPRFVGLSAARLVVAAVAEARSASPDRAAVSVPTVVSAPNAALPATAAVTWLLARAPISLGTPTLALLVALLLLPFAAVIAARAHAVVQAAGHAAILPLAQDLAPGVALARNQTLIQLLSLLPALGHPLLL